MKNSTTHQVCNKHLKLLGGKATCCNCDEKTDCDWEAPYPMKPDIEQFIAGMNKKKMAEAFAKGDAYWHEKEWKEFIEAIRKDERSKLLTALKGEIENKKENAKLYPMKGLDGEKVPNWNEGYNSALREVIALINDSLP